MMKNWLDWLVIEKTLPETGKTIAEEFVEQHPPLSEDIKQGMLRMKNIVRGRFEVVSIKGRELVLEALSTHKQYKVKLSNEAPFLRKRSLVEGRIHPFDDHYRFCGAYNSQSPPS